MQTISTNEWTQITGLDGSKTYVLQAQYQIGERPAQPIEVMWKQSETEPQTDDIGVITDRIKAKGSVAIYVKSVETPVNIIAQGVI